MKGLLVLLYQVKSNIDLDASLRTSYSSSSTAIQIDYHIGASTSMRSIWKEIRVLLLRNELRGNDIAAGSSQYMHRTAAPRVRGVDVSTAVESSVLPVQYG